MEIETGRFVLRDFREEDQRAFLTYHTDPRYLALSGPEMADPGHALGLFETFKLWASERPRRNHQLAIIQKASRKLVGSCGLRGAGCDKASAELGIELAPKYWGGYGYAIEVARGLLAFGFGTLGHQEIYGVSTSGNARVARLARCFGAEVTDTFPGPDWIQARGWSQVRWRITAEQWDTIKSARIFSGRVTE